MRRPKNPVTVTVVRGLKTVRDLKQAIDRWNDDIDEAEDSARICVSNMGSNPGSNDLCEAESLVEELKSIEYKEELVELAEEKLVKLETD